MMRSSFIALAAAMTLGSGVALAQSASPQTAPSAKPTTPPAAAAAAKLSDADCSAAWQKAIGSSKSVTLDEASSKSFVRDFKAADVNSDKKIDKSEWTSACSKGLVVASADAAKSGDTAKPDAGVHPPTNRMDSAVPPMKAK